MNTLETERLILRPFEETDLEDFFEYAKNPNVGPCAGWPPHSSKEDSYKILCMFMQNDEVWALEYKENHKVIGSMGLHKDPLRSAEDVKMLGYVLSEDYWGQGIIVEAIKAVLDFTFGTLNLALLSVHHYSFNQQSKRVIEKCGFVKEGTLRHAAQIYNSSIYDIVCYSMTKEEWKN
jgi:ribosomal-protein-alanine N-acetyltransferase